MQTKTKIALKSFPCMIDKTPSDSISILSHENGTKGRCRVFFSFSDYQDFLYEHPDYAGVEMSYILGTMDNLPRLRNLLGEYDEIFSYQCRHLKRQRLVLAYGYTREKLDELIHDFIHDHEMLLKWEPEIPS